MLQLEIASMNVPDTKSFSFIVPSGQHDEFVERLREMFEWMGMQYKAVEFSGNTRVKVLMQRPPKEWAMTIKHAKNYVLQFCVLWRDDVRNLQYWTVEPIKIKEPICRSVDEIIHAGNQALRLSLGNRDGYFCMGPVFHIASG
jgi:hypothetical protein